MRKIFVIPLIGLFTVFVSVSVYAYDFQSGGIYYNIGQNNTVSVTKGEDKYVGTVSIPERVRNGNTSFSVLSIGNEAFQNCSELTSVTIPNSVLIIGELSFAHCKSLVSVTIPDNITHVGNSAFIYCTGLSSVTIGSSVTSIGIGAFWGCNNLSKITSNIKQPFNVSDNAFGSWETDIYGTATLNVPAGTKSLYQNTAGWNKFTNIVESTSQTQVDWQMIGDDFDKSIAFTKIRIKNKKSSSDSYCCIFFSTKPNDNTTSDTYYNINFYKLNIGDNHSQGTSNLYVSSCTDVGDGWYEYEFKQTVYFSHYQTNAPRAQVMAYVGNQNSGSKRTIHVVTAGTLPNYISDSEKYTIEELILTGELNGTDFRLLRDVAGNNYLGENTSGKLSVLDMSGVKIVKGGEKYVDTNSLPDWSGTFHYTVEKADEMPQHVFHGCNKLTSVVLPNSLTSIGDYAFWKCSGLTSITIPVNVSKIGKGTFVQCSKLTAISVVSSNAYYTSVDGVLYDKNKKILCAYPMGKGSSYTIPNGVTSIGDYAFRNCSGLTSITLPNSLTSIGNYAFFKCTSLTSINSEIQNPFEIREVVFSSDTYSKATLTVPKWKKSLYQSTAGWNHFENIVEAGDANTFTDNGIYYQLMSDGTLEVTGLSSSTKRADIPSSLTINGTKYRVTSIGESAFEGRSDITYLSIQYSMMSIGKNAFRNCGNKITVNIANLESWCKMELGNEYSSPLSCAGKVLLYDVETTSVNIPETITSIGKFTFYGCRSITSLSISGSVTSIGSSAFEDCTGLTSLTLSDGLESIGGSAFEGCTGLSAITIPSTVSEILINAFQGCSNMKDITSKIKTPFAIDSNAFSTYTTATLTVPYGTKSAYKSTSGWNRFSNIVEDDSGQPIIVTAKSYSREYGEANPSFDYTTYGADLKGTPTISCDATKTSPVGTYTITIEKGSVTNENVSFVNGTLTITKAPLTVTAKDCSREQGQANPTFELTYSGFKNNETEDVLTSKPTASTKATTSSAPGQYVITVSGGEAQNYDFKYVSGILTVTEKEEVAFTIDGTTYQGIKTDKTVIVKFVDKDMRCLEIPASVSYDGSTYQVTGIADNAFNGSNMAALIWNVEKALPGNVFSNASIGSNFLLYVKSSSYAPSSVKNVVVNGTASLIELSDDGGQFYCPQAFTAKSISYTHNYSMETGGNGKGWETLVLPFDVQKITHSTRGELVPFAGYRSDSSQKPFWLANFSGIGFRRASAILANEPYIIAMPNSSNYNNNYNLVGDVTFSADNVQVPQTPAFSGTFLPAYSTVSKSSTVYALNVSNRYVKYSGNYDAGSRFINNLRDVRPFEAYISDNSTRGVFEINLNDGMTDMEDVLLSADEGVEITIHTLSGQQVGRTVQHDFNQVWSRLLKGVYIVNGKKMIK